MSMVDGQLGFSLEAYSVNASRVDAVLPAMP